MSFRRSMHYNVVAVEPLYENGAACSQKALLSPQSTQPTKLSSAVIAEEHGGWKSGGS